MDISPQNTPASGSGLPFRKMHGLGNDFVIFDARTTSIDVTPALVRAVGHRHFGVGFDQLAVLRATSGGAPHEVLVEFWNADGSTAGACGNASRCIARILLDETGAETVVLITERGRLPARREGTEYSVNMGPPRLGWQDIPLARACETLELPLAGGPTATNMGNPHCSFFVDDIDSRDLEALGQQFETDPLFPEQTNVQLVQRVGPDHLRVRVWERGVGVTLASGSSSCAAVVSAVRRGLCGRRVRVDLDGGALMIDWRDDGVWMTGAASHVFEGTLSPELLDTCP